MGGHRGADAAATLRVLRAGGSERDDGVTLAELLAAMPQ
jgi:hypothetical protein